MAPKKSSGIYVLASYPTYVSRMFFLWSQRENKEVFERLRPVENLSHGRSPWPQRDQLIAYHSVSHGLHLPVWASFSADLTFLPNHPSSALTGSTFLYNLPWQGENISIKYQIPWLTRHGARQPVRQPLCTSCTQFISFPIWYICFVFLPSFTSTSSLLLSLINISSLLSNICMFAGCLSPLIQI